MTCESTSLPHATVVEVHGQVLVFRGRTDDGPYCTAANERGKRCTVSLLIEDWGQWGEIYVAGTEGYLPAMKRNAAPDSDDSWLRQRCWNHMKDDAAALLDPEWELFDPARHSDLIVPTGPLWKPGGVDPNGSRRAEKPEHSQAQTDEVYAKLWGGREPGPLVSVADLLDSAELETRRVFGNMAGSGAPDWHADVLLSIILPELRAALRTAGLEVPTRGPYSAHRDPLHLPEDSEADCEAGDTERTVPARAVAEEAVETILYRWYDAAGLLLYIGISDHLGSRTKGHAKGSSWMDFAASSTVERHPSRPLALDAEETAIKAEKPLFNHQHNQSPEAQRRLVDYLIGRGRVDLLAAAVSRG